MLTCSKLCHSKSTLPVSMSTSWAMLSRTLPPGEHRSALIVLHLEVPGGPVLAIPHKLSDIVDDHWAMVPRALLGSGEYVPGGSFVVRLRRSHLGCSRGKIRARAKGPYAFRSRR